MRRQRGFTLIEVLAATALFAVLGTMLFQIVRGAMNIWSSGERSRELHDRASAALDALAIDLRDLWPGLTGAAEQDSRFLCSWREEGATGGPAFTVPVLRFARVCHEARTLSWLRRAGDVAGAQDAAELLTGQESKDLLPTGGLAESLYTLAVLPGQHLPSLVRRFRTPIGGQGSLLDAGLPEQRERMLKGAIVLADQVLYFGVACWAPGTTHWDKPPDATGVAAPVVWDSTRGLLPPEDPGFPFGRGPASLLDGSDDLFPRRVRLTLVLDDSAGDTAGGALAEAVSAESKRIVLASTTFLREQAAPDHVLVEGEWMKVTDLDGRTLSVVRGVRGTTAVSHADGAKVRAGATFERVLELPAARENWNP